MSKRIKNLTLSALFIAIGLVLPFFTGQLKALGNAFLPMHLPVLLCGLIEGPMYGLIVGLILPILRHFTFGMPPLYPTAISMAFELATYGFVVGFVNSLAKKWDSLSQKTKKIISGSLFLVFFVLWILAGLNFLGYAAFMSLALSWTIAIISFIGMMAVGCMFTILITDDSENLQRGF